MRPPSGSEVPTGVPVMSDHPTLVPPPESWGEPGGLVGQTFGDFDLTAEVGRGSMGVVYKARQKSLERDVALKLLLPEHASNPHLLKRFLAEARAAASLTHPNIISIYQVGECPAGPYFVMEYIEGPSLERLSARTLPIPWVVAVMITVAEAVHHAHERGIVHRDLKPGNILLHRNKRPVVMDFGIAKNLGKQSRSSTTLGTLIGTPAYMPPEQAGEEPSKIGPHSDVYSLGAILYRMLTGKVPFDESTAMRTILKVVSSEPPPPLRAARPEVPAELEQIVLRCLEKNPTARYGSAQELADDLKRFRAGHRPRPSAPPPLAKLSLIGPDGKRLRISTAKTIIGRSLDCDVVLKSPDVSKHHCRILLGPDAASVEDLGSVNGTFLNGTPVRRSALEDGDELDVAGQIFRVRLRIPEEG